MSSTLFSSTPVADMLDMRTLSSSSSSSACSMFKDLSRSSDSQTDLESSQQTLEDQLQTLVTSSSNEGDMVSSHADSTNDTEPISRELTPNPDFTPKSTKVSPLRSVSHIEHDMGYESDYEADEKVQPVNLRRRRFDSRRLRQRVDVAQSTQAVRLLAPAPVSRSQNSPRSPVLRPKRPVNIDDQGSCQAGLRQKALIGLGLGLPSDHPLRTPRFCTTPCISSRPWVFSASSRKNICSPPPCRLPSAPKLPSSPAFFISRLNSPHSHTSSQETPSLDVLLSASEVHGESPVSNLPMMQSDVNRSPPYARSVHLRPILLANTPSPIERLPSPMYAGMTLLRDMSPLSFHSPTSSATTARNIEGFSSPDAGLKINFGDVPLITRSSKASVFVGLGIGLPSDYPALEADESRISRSFSDSAGQRVKENRPFASEASPIRNTTPTQIRHSRAVSPLVPSPQALIGLGLDLEPYTLSIKPQSSNPSLNSPLLKSKIHNNKSRSCARGATISLLDRMIFEKKSQNSIYPGERDAAPSTTVPQYPKLDDKAYIKCQEIFQKNMRLRSRSAKMASSPNSPFTSEK